MSKSKTQITPAYDYEGLVKKAKEFRWDFPTFCSDCLWIQTKQGGELVPFVLNRNQIYIWEHHIKPMLIAGEPVRLIVLKARQIGMSTFFMALMYWFVSLRGNRNAIVAAYNEKSVNNLYEKTRIFYAHSPTWIRPEFRIMNRERLHFASKDVEDKTGLNSQIVTDTSDNVQIGRSWALHFFLGSEAPLWSNPVPVVTAVQNAIPKNTPGTFIIYEGTSAGMNYYYTMWQEAEERDLHRIFISWCAMDEYRLELDDAEIVHIYADRYDFEHEVYGDEMAEAQNIADQLRDWYNEAEDEAWLYREVACRLAWRRKCIEQDCNKILDEFKKEYPTTEQDAWVSTGKSIFPTVKLASQREAFRAGMASGRIDPVRFRWNDSLANWEQNNRGHLWMFEPLQEDATYVLGADVALGLDRGDYSSFVLLRLPDCVVSAVFWDRVPPTMLASMLYDVGRRAGDALLGVEANEEGGYSCNTELRDLGYPYLYRREQHDTIQSRRMMKIGWKTSAVSKDHMISDLRKAITYDDIIINGDELFDQLMSYQEYQIGSQGRKQRGCPPPMHDDVATGCMIAYQMAKRQSTQVLHMQQRIPEGSLLDIEERLASLERDDMDDLFEGGGRPGFGEALRR